MRKYTLLLSIASIWIGALLALFIKMETPLGSVEGVVLAGENGKPIPKATVTFSPLSTGKGIQSYSAQTDDEGHFIMRGIPVGVYSVYCSSSAHRLPEGFEGRERYVRIKEGETTQLLLVLRRFNVSLSLWVDKPIYTPQQRINIWASGYAPSDKLSLYLYRLELEKLAPSQLFELGNYVYPWRQPGKPPEISLPLSLVAKWEEKIQRDVEDTFQWGKKLPAPGTGFYQLEARANNISSRTFFLVTDLSLLIKQDGRRSLIWATTLDNGTPLPDVQLIVESRGRISLAKTNSKGLWEGEDLGPTKIVGKFGSSYAFLKLEEYELPVSKGTKYKIYIYTERPVYRPGQTVFFKSIVRKVEAEEYKVPPPISLAVDVRDEEGNIVYGTMLKTNQFGSCFGSFKIPPTAKPGSYNISASSIEEQAYGVGYFNVSVYRKPEFEVKIKPSKSAYRLGEKARIEVEANYLFGVPLVGGTIEYEVYRFPLLDGIGEEYYMGEEFPERGYGEMVQTGTAKTNSRGKAVIYIPLKKEPARMRDYHYSVDVTVTDASGRSASATTSFEVVRSPIRVEMFIPRKIFKVGEKEKVRISFHAPYKGKGKVRLSLYKLLWKGEKAEKRRQAEWWLEMKDKEKRTISLLLKEEGEYELTARVGKEILDSVLFDVLPSLEEGGYSLPGKLKRPRLILDKETYKKGENARAILDLPFKASVLLTYEGKYLYKYEVRQLERGRYLLNISTLGFAEYLSLETNIVRKGQLIRESAGFDIVSPVQRLRLTIRTDKKTYQPRDEVLCKVKVLDNQGKPLKGELSIAVVDEGIFKVMEEHADEDIRSFFAPEGFLRVITRWSGEEIYLGAVSKAFAPTEVRQYFPDTAFWLPSLVTDEEGNASFRFKLPDNITSWRITAVGNTLANIFGANKKNILVQKPLFVRLAVPPFFRQGDITTITGIIHNQTKEKQKIKVELSTDTLTVFGNKEKDLEVEAKGKGEVQWRIKVGEVRSATLRIYAIAKSGLKDAMKLTLPVLSFGLPKDYRKGGQVERSLVEKINIDRNAIPSTIELRLYLAPSITSSLFSALEYLAQYPYGCTEQTVSTLLPDIAIYRLLKERRSREGKLKQLLPDMIRKGIFRLYRLKHSDGGWGWIESDLTLPWTTAYALWGLWEANKAGFPVNEYVLKEGKETLLKLMKQELDIKTVPKLGEWEREERLFALYVLTLMGEDTSPYLEYFLPLLAKLSPKEKALLTLSYLNLGNRKKAEALFHSLWQDRKENGDICYWVTKYEGVEDTAYALRALLKLQPHNPVALKSMNYILAMRRGREWHSTKDTAQVILTLLEFSKIWEDFHPNFRLSLQINGKTIRSFHFTEREVFSSPVQISLGANDLKVGENEIRFLKQGKGRCFYSLELEQVLRKTMIEPDEGLAGIKVKRVYRPLSISNKGILEWKTGSPREEFGKDQLIEVEVRIRLLRKDIPSAYFILEEPLPAGCEFMGLSDEEEWWDYDELGDKVAFYIPYLKREELKLRYRLRTEMAGDYRVMPTLIYNMYFPQYRSIGNSNKVRVK